MASLVSTDARPQEAQLPAQHSAGKGEPEFVEFPKMARFAREIIVTEKIDGTNAQVWISDDGTEIRAGSAARAG
jgi:hypothetical protein